MKKSLLAVAAMTAFAGAAQAQSSVTVYGILDVGYTGANYRSSTPTGGTFKSTMNRFSNSMESGSRLGFRGTEDLGGGLAANFVYEMGITPAGDTGSTTTAQSGAGAIRQAYVALAKKGLGDGRVGTQNTLFWEQAGSNTTGQLAQTLGSMLAPTTAGAFSANTINSINSGTPSNNNGSATDAYTVRTNNTVSIRTERMAGLVAKAAYTMSNVNSTQSSATIPAGSTGYTGGTNNQNGYQFALDYVFQKANIQASYAGFTSENPYSYTTQVAALGGLGGATGAPLVWGNGLQGTNVKDDQTLITGSYDFGILKAYAGWTNRKVTSVVNSNAFLKRSAQEIGVRSFVTPTIEAWASVGNGRFSTFGAGQPTANITGYQVGSNYWMSKRTNLYAIYGQNGTSNSTNGAFNANQYSIGARHTF